MSIGITIIIAGIGAGIGFWTGMVVGSWIVHKKNPQLAFKPSETAPVPTTQRNQTAVAASEEDRKSARVAGVRHLRKRTKF